MKRIISFMVFCTLCFSAVTAAPQQQFITLEKLALESGEIMQDVHMGYRVMGELNSDSSNVICYPTWFGGTSENISVVVSKYRLINTEKWCVIAVDALGNGISESPSNSKKYPGESYPDVTMADMADAVHSVMQDLGFDHIHAMFGGSMGSMQCFEVIESYPGFADKAVVYVSTPRETAYDLMMHEIYLNIIEMGRKYDIPDEEYMKPANLLNYVNGRTPEYFSTQLSCKDGKCKIKTQETYSPGIFTADNFYVQIKAIHGHNIAKNYNNDMSKAAKNIKAKTLIIVNKQDHSVSPYAALELAPMIKAETLIVDNYHGHLGIIPEVKKIRKKIDRFLK